MSWRSAPRILGSSRHHQHSDLCSHRSMHASVHAAASQRIAIPPSTARAECSSSSPAHSSRAQHVRRRDVIAGTAFVLSLQRAGASQAAPEAVSKTWQAITGAQPDLFFPESFLGDWEVIATLKNVETPLGMGYVQDARVVESARLGVGKQVKYPQRFIRNASNRVVPDRAFNTVRLLEAMSDAGAVETSEWNPDDPNVLRLKLKGGRGVFVRVTARLQEEPEPSRILTSEVVEQVLDSVEGAGPPRLRKSRCVTKYKYRSAAEAQASGGGPEIIANQVVYDYADLREVAASLESRGEPTVVYSYGLAFFRSGAA